MNNAMNDYIFEENYYGRLYLNFSSGTVAFAEANATSNVEQGSYGALYPISCLFGISSHIFCLLYQLRYADDVIDAF